MRIKFEGNTHSIDANTLVSILRHYQTIAQEANREYGGGSRDIKVTVNAIERGSFIIDLSVVQNLVDRLFSKNTVEYIAGLSAIIAGMFTIYKALKGRPANTMEDKEKAKGEVNVKVVSPETVINIYNRPTVRKAVSESLERADDDAAVEGFSVADGETEAHFSKEEFKDYIYDDFGEEDETPDERRIETEATLTIIGLKFERNSRWQFLYMGRRITITVRDGALMDRIDAGERFGKGDSIKVRMQIVQSFNRDFMAYEDRSYRIIELLEYKEHGRTQGMFGKEGGEACGFVGKMKKRMSNSPS